MEKNDKKEKKEINFRVVLYQPEIPSNTGNIGRLCVGANTELHIIKPMRFLITDKYLKRAGLDYWDKLDIFFYENIEELFQKYPESSFYFLTTKSRNIYYERSFKKGDFFMFGPETRGLPESLLKRFADNALTIPMSDKIRSINLSNSVAIVLYEALRQIGFR